MGQIGPNSSATFGSPNSDLKKFQICPNWGQSDPLWSQTYHSCPTGISPVLTCKQDLCLRSMAVYLIYLSRHFWLLTTWTNLSTFFVGTLNSYLFKILKSIYPELLHLQNNILDFLSAVTRKYFFPLNY